MRIHKKRYRASTYFSYSRAETSPVLYIQIEITMMCKYLSSATATGTFNVNKSCFMCIHDIVYVLLHSRLLCETRTRMKVRESWCSWNQPVFRAIYKYATLSAQWVFCPTPFLPLFRPVCAVATDVLSPLLTSICVFFSFTLPTPIHHPPLFIRSQVVSKLVQIREYISKASSMRDDLVEKNDVPANVERLSHLIDHLKEQEKSYLRFLQKMLVSPSFVHSWPFSELIDLFLLFPCYTILVSSDLWCVKPFFIANS